MKKFLNSGWFTLLVVIAAVLLLIWHDSSAFACYEEMPTQKGKILVEHKPIEQIESSQCPLTEEEYNLLAELMTAEAEIVLSQGTKWGVSSHARVAAVGWTVFNRYDAGFEKTLERVIKAPYQYAWHPGIKVSTRMLELAKDIGWRWWMEKQTGEFTGRTLPSNYYYFGGDGRENHFRTQYERTGINWNWSLPDPYLKED